MRHSAWNAKAPPHRRRRLERRGGARRIVWSFRLDAAARFRKAVARHEAAAAGIDLRGMTGAEMLAQRASSLDAGGLPKDVRRTRAASRLENMPRLRDRVGEVVGWLETRELQDRAADFRASTAFVEARPRERDTLPLHADGYGRATEIARALTDRHALPASVHREEGAWVDRDREWREQLDAARDLTGEEGWRADPAERRAAARLPAVAEAVRRKCEFCTPET